MYKEIEARSLSCKQCEILVSICISERSKLSVNFVYKMNNNEIGAVGNSRVQFEYPVQRRTVKYSAGQWSTVECSDFVQWGTKGYNGEQWLCTVGFTV